MIFENLMFFWGWSQMNLEPFLDQKSSILTQKTMIFKWKIPARAPQLEARSGKDSRRDVM